MKYVLFGRIIILLLIIKIYDDGLGTPIEKVFLNNWTYLSGII